MKVSANPVLLFIQDLLASGKTTKEKLCVACDIKYPTLDNIFFRNRVSPMIRKSLLYAGILPEKVYHAYEDWYRNVYRPAAKAEKAGSCPQDYDSSEVGGDEEARA